MDLTNADVDDEGNPTEALKPKSTYNPVIQYFNQCVASKAMKGPTSELPKIDNFLIQYMSPDKDLLEKSASSINKFAEKFPLQKK